MNRKELKRSYIIRMAVDGKITVGQAASALNLCTRRNKQLKASYKKNGDQIFIHGNKNKVSSKKISDTVRQEIITFRKKQLGEKIFKTVNAILEKEGKIMHGGTIIDATIIEAPPSTKNEMQQRDKEMHSTKKGNQWHFGMKAHIGVDAGSGIVHSITATSANVHDIKEAHKLIREDDDVVYGDAGYQEIEKREEIKNDEILNLVKVAG